MLRRIACLARPWLQGRACSSSAAVQQPSLQVSDQAAAVRNELSSAGVPDSTIAKCLRSYEPYKRWSVARKLRPQIQVWKQELGHNQFLIRLAASPNLLRLKPDKLQHLLSWLVSLGVADPPRLLRMQPSLLERQLISLQQRVAELKGYGVSDVGKFLELHPYVLVRTPERLQQVWQALADVLQMPLRSAELAQFVQRCSSSVYSPFAIPPSLLTTRLAFYSNMSNGSQATLKDVLYRGYYTVPESVMQHRTSALGSMLELDAKQLQVLLSRNPALLASRLDTSQAHLSALVDLGFSKAQVSAMCVACPKMLTLNWESAKLVEKWNFLLHVACLDHGFLSRRPDVMLNSLTNLLAQHMYVQYLSSCGVSLVSRHGVQLSFNIGRDPQFARKVKGFSHVLQYNAAFKAEVWERWQLLRHLNRVAIKDIASHQKLLLVSVKDVLKPRFAFLDLVAAQQNSFDLVKHLANVASLDDQAFASAYNQGQGQSALLYDAEFKDSQQHQEAVAS